MTSELAEADFRVTIEAGPETGLRVRSQVMADKPVTVRRERIGQRFGRLQAADLALRSGSPSSARLEEMSLEEVEAFLIKKALARYNGNVSHAASALGLSRSALYRRLQRYGL